MKIHNNFLKALCVVLIMSLTACGTIMYPERKGQISGQIDPGIAILDAVGLLFYLVPGVIAFAVDFNNGTIYLPGTGSSLDTDKGGLHSMTTTKKIDAELLESLVLKETGKNIDLHSENVYVEKIDINKVALRIIALN